VLRPPAGFVGKLEPDGQAAALVYFDMVNQFGQDLPRRLVYVLIFSERCQERIFGANTSIRFGPFRFQVADSRLRGPGLPFWMTVIDLPVF